MKFLVCLKQVPDSTVRVKVAADGKSIATDGITWSISPYDEYAIELALEHKDSAPDTVVSVITVGGARTKDALRQALAMGCDDATLVTGDGADGLGPLGIANALKGVVEELKPDLVLCGKQASDDDQGFVGPALAEALGWPHVSQVTRFEIVGPAAPAPARSAEAWKETEGGHEGSGAYVALRRKPYLLTNQHIAAVTEQHSSLAHILADSENAVRIVRLAQRLQERAHAGIVAGAGENDRARPGEVLVGGAQHHPEGGGEALHPIAIQAERLARFPVARTGRVRSQFRRSK